MKIIGCRAGLVLQLSAHFSSLIMTGQMTRDEALDRISRPEMDEHFLTQEFEYVAHKLGLSVTELQAIFDSPKKTYRDYKNKRWLIGFGANAMRWLGLEKGTSDDPDCGLWRWQYSGFHDAVQASGH